MTPIVLACERCLSAPATCYDSHTDQALCGDCGKPYDDTAYSCEFMLDYVPSDIPAWSPPRPTLEVEG